jgi:ATP-binding cassette subfamily B protein
MKSLQKAINTAELTAFYRNPARKTRYHCFRKRVEPFRRAKAADHAGPGTGCEPESTVARRFHGPGGQYNTEKKILANVERNYPGITLISVTQKIAAIEHYDQIVVLMEGE